MTRAETPGPIGRAGVPLSAAEKNSLPPIILKPHHNYVAFFLTLACNLRCPYCINLHRRPDQTHKGVGKEMPVDDWIRAADRLVLRDDLPLTLQGGEPTLYKGFYRFVHEVKKEIKMDLLTNMMFNVEEFIKQVPPWRFTREAPYAAIRVSYHPGQNRGEDLIQKTKKLQDAGFRIGIYGIQHPDPGIQEDILKLKDECLTQGIDFRHKEFLGEYQGALFGTFKYKDSVSADPLKRCLCRTTELIVDPAGSVYRCHADLYKHREPVAHILDRGFSEENIDTFRDCCFYGDCNPCDVKVKTNRFQIFGHTSVEIKDIQSDPNAVIARRPKADEASMKKKPPSSKFSQ